jgi:hypothetical protein
VLDSGTQQQQQRWCSSITAWLKKHGAAITHLSIERSKPATGSLALQLPFHELQLLQSLRIRSCQLIQHPHQQDTMWSNDGDESWPSLSRLTSLTALELDHVEYGLDGGLSALAALSGLQQLQLGSLTLPQTNWSYERMMMNMQGGVCWLLGHLLQLRQLKLHVELLPDKIPGPFRFLQQLQELELLSDGDCVGVHAPVVLVGLPISLTKLHFDWGSFQGISGSTVPALLQLTALQELHIAARMSTGIRPAFCSSMLQLRHLTLVESFDSIAVQQLLEVVPRLSSLQSLSICNESAATRQLPASDLARYAAILPPSVQHLTQLELCCMNGGLLPPGSLQYVFAAGLQLPQLKRLVLGLPEKELELPFDDFFRDTFGEMRHCVGSSELRQIVNCCPALEQLWLAGALQPNADLSPLLQLTQLACSVTGGDAVDDRAVATVVAKFQGLRRLELYCCKGVTDRSLLFLALMFRLTALRVWECSCSKEVSLVVSSTGMLLGWASCGTECLETEVRSHTHACLLGVMVYSC